MAQATRFDSKKCLLGIQMTEKYIQGVYDPKKLPLFQTSSNITPKRERSMTLKRHVSATYLQCITYMEWISFLLNLQKYTAHGALRWRGLS
jgi:hypothetical protein